MLTALLLKRRFYLITVPAILLAVTFYISQKPYYNWDMFPYMALVKCGETSLVPFKSCQAQVYEEAESKMIPGDFEAIAQRQPELRADWAAFQDILKYYKIKPGYNMVVRDFHSLGFNLLAATYLPSVISYLFIGCLLIWWMLKIFSPPIAGLVTLLCAAAPFLVQTARYSSPDMLCAALLLGGLFLICEGSIIYGLAVCAVAISVRPDAVIFFLLLIVALSASKKIAIKKAAVFGVLATSAALFIVGPAMIREFLFTTPSYSPSWSVGRIIINYFLGLINGLDSMLTPGIIIFILLSAATLFIRHKLYPDTLNDFWSLLVIAALASFVIRYLLHPITEDRFLIIAYLITILGFSNTLTNIFPKSKAHHG